MEMVHARDFAGLRAAVRNHRLAKAELVVGLGKRLIHHVASIIPTKNEHNIYSKLFHELVLGLNPLVGGLQVDNWHI